MRCNCWTPWNLKKKTVERPLDLYHLFSPSSLFKRILHSLFRFHSDKLDCWSSFFGVPHDSLFVEITQYFSKWWDGKIALSSEKWLLCTTWKSKLFTWDAFVARAERQNNSPWPKHWFHYFTLSALHQNGSLSPSLSYRLKRLHILIYKFSTFYPDPNSHLNTLHVIVRPLRVVFFQFRVG